MRAEKIVMDRYRWGAQQNGQGFVDPGRVHNDIMLYLVRWSYRQLPGRPVGIGQMWGMSFPEVGVRA